MTARDEEPPQGSPDGRTRPRFAPADGGDRVADALPGLGALLGGLPDGLTVHDGEGRYLYVSPSFERLSGFDSADLLGACPFDLDLFHTEDVDRVVEVQAGLLEGEGDARVVYRLRRKDGAFTWVESTTSAVPTPAGTRLVVLTREASHLESLVQGVTQERQAKLQLEELVARQRHFLTTVSHRARTPLTAVVGMAKVLQQRGERMEPEQREELLGRVVANADRLMEVLDSVTEADRLTRADVMLERRVVDLRQLALEVVDEVTADATNVTVAIAEDERAVVDREKVARILRILLHNAFTHAGVGTWVTITAEAGPQGVELVVEDDGPGVEPADRTRIFEPFTQAQVDAADPGAGLGLYLVSELAALHGGRVWVDDRQGGGARFHVSLPRDRAGGLAPGSRRHADASGSEQRSRPATTPASDRVVSRAGASDPA